MQKKAIGKHCSQNTVKSTDGSSSQRASYEWLNLGHSGVSGQIEIFSFSFSVIKTNVFLLHYICEVIYYNFAYWQYFQCHCE